MLICPKYKFVFVRVAKTGSGSVVTALENITGCKRLNSSILHTHSTCMQIVEHNGIELFDKNFTFAFVRNPWDRLYSSYCYSKWNRQLIDSNMSFNDWLKADVQMRGLTRSQHYMLTDDAGQIMVNYVGRYERLQEDFDHICTTLHLPITQLPVINASKHKDTDYLRAFDDDALEIARAVTELDAKTFGYDIC